MAVPSGVTFGWTGTHASVPTGYTRKTALDTYFLKVNSTTAGGTGGGNHTHDGSHNHDFGSHTHSVPNSGSASIGSRDIAGSGGGTEAIEHTHTHTGGTSDPSDSSTDTNSETSSSNSGQPSRYEVIWIESNGTDDIPVGAIAWTNSATIPSGWAFCNGSGGTPDLRQKYLKGAGTGLDAGTSAAAVAHNHTYVHDHSGNHSHDYQYPGNPSGFNASGTGYEYKEYDHNHFTNWSTGLANTGNSGSTTANDSTAPLSYDLVPIQKTGSDADPTTNVIAVWTGTTGSIPSDWENFSAPDGRFIRGANTTGGSGTLSGSATHTHTYSHNHSLGSHTHSVSGKSKVGTTGHAALGATTVSLSHDHDAVTSGSGSGITTSDDGSLDTASNDPPYYEVILIRYKIEFIVESTPAYTAAPTIPVSDDTEAFLATLEILSDGTIAFVGGIESPVEAQESYLEGIVGAVGSQSAYLLASAPGKIGLIYRRVDANNYWEAYVDRTTLTLKLDKIIGGVRTNRSTVNLDGSELTDGELRVLFMEDHHRVWWKRRLRINLRDVDLKDTGVGVGPYQENAVTNGTVTFDDFYAQGV